MTFADIVVSLLIAAAVAAAIAYLVRQKRQGAKCLGCSACKTAGCKVSTGSLGGCASAEGGATGGCASASACPAAQTLAAGLQELEKK